MPQIRGSNAIVIGGTHGIGLATAQLLLEKGAKVIITGHNTANLQSAKAQLKDEAIICGCDITSLEAITNLATTVSENYGSGPQLDLVFINAGYANLGPFNTVSEASFRHTFDTNVFGAFFVAQSFAPLVKSGGSIIFTTSIANRRGIPGMSVYSASKAAVHSFTQTLAAELAGKNVRVNAVSPGYIKTPTMGVVDTPKEALATFEAEGAQITPLGRIGNSEEVAKTVLYLGYDATFTTGSEVVVDGGLLSLVKATH